MHSKKYIKMHDATHEYQRQCKLNKTLTKKYRAH